MRTFFVETLGCKVNQYEGEQVASLLKARGLVRATSAHDADIRVIHTCSVTNEAASKSRQTVRRMVRLPVLEPVPATNPSSPHRKVGVAPPNPNLLPPDTNPRLPAGATDPRIKHQPALAPRHPAARVIVTGCWATSHSHEARALEGVDAVVTNHQDVALELDRLLCRWRETGRASQQTPLVASHEPTRAVGDEGRDERNKAGSDGVDLGDADNKSRAARRVNQNPSVNLFPNRQRKMTNVGAVALPLLGERQSDHQRALLKIQDGCDAHCTYCIIPTLRPRPWSKSVDDVVEEATRLVDAGHVELVLTGIFLGAYGQPTALRRRQDPARPSPLGELIDALCTRVRGLRRLRLSSLEPGDLDDALVATLREHPQVVPHFHLPLQSGSNAILRRMNRQYTRDDFLRLIDRVHAAFDRPALTTDVIAGFPGETDAEFVQTLDVVRRAGFIHVHAFPFSPRPGTAAARWREDFVHGTVAATRIEHLRELSIAQGFAFRQSFVGQEVELLVERPSSHDAPSQCHGRCETRARSPNAFVRAHDAPNQCHGRCER